MPRKILVIYNSGRIGDTLLITPAIRAIHENNPDASITFYGHRNTLFLFEGLDFIKTRRAISKRKALFFGRHYFKIYDKTFVFNSNNEIPSQRYINLAQRISKKIFCYTDNKAKHEAHQSVFSAINTIGDEHLINRFLRLIALDGIVTSNKQLAYSVLTHERNDGAHLLRTLEKDKPTIRVGFKLTSFQTRSYRDWPLDSFNELIKSLLAWNPMVHCYIFGTPSDEAATNYLSKIDSTRIHALTNLKLRSSAAIMEQLHLYIGVDTGPSHLMSTFNKPTIILYHCLSPSRLFGPLWSTNVVTYDLEDIQSNCDKHSPMSLIRWEDIFNKSKEILSKL